jgi:hypothetical protein
VTNEKLLGKLSGFMDLNRKKQKEEKVAIRALLKKLKKRQRNLQEKLGKESDASKRKRIKRDLKVLHAQRKKGIKLCRSIKC